MASQGPNNGGTFANESSVGTIDWSPTSGATSQDFTGPEASLAESEISHYFKATNFGFSIPGGATIDGVVVEVSKDGSQVYDSSIRLVKGGTISGDDKADPVTPWSDYTGIYASYGDASDLWGLALSDSDINGSTFGVVVAATTDSLIGSVALIDHIRITVHYTEAAAGGNRRRRVIMTRPA